MSKAQLLSQVFVFFIAAVILVMILLFGYKYITEFIKQQKQMELIQFKEDLTNGVNSIRTRFDSRDQLKLSIPSGYDELCFVDSEGSERLRQKRPLLHNLWNLDRNQTVFLIPLPELNIKLDNIAVDNGFCCIKAEPKLDLKLESLGKKVKISPWEQECETEE